MRLRSALAVGLGLGLAFTAVAQAQKNKLSIGDAAPGLDIQEWVKGEEVSIEKGNVYVIEFWATWCGPCRKSIPHLTKLQEEYGDDGLKIIGVSDEEPETVKKFVERQGRTMDYTVAVDRRKSTKRAWFEASGQRGIPAAFVVDRESEIVFIGHPLSEDFEEVIRLTLNGRFNARLARQAKPLLDRAKLERELRNWRMAVRQYKEIIEIDPRVFAMVGLQQFEMYLVDMNDREQAYKFAREDLIGKYFVDDPEAIAALAVKVATDNKIPNERRDLDFALEAAQLAKQMARTNEPEAFRVLAQIHYARGDFDKAYQNQREAWKLARTKYKLEFRRELDLYHQASLGSREE